MCGLVGIIASGTVVKGMVDVVSQLIEVDSLRGRHSTGVMRIDKKGMCYYKSALSGPEFVATKGGDEFLYGGKGVKALIAHNRWATKGAVNHLNAHPFRHGHITLMHNGTLRGQYLLPDSARFEVDSENIAWSMQKIGEKETLEKLSGAFALAWFNEQDNTINFARNGERPLWFGLTQLGNVIYASERLMLEWICARNGVILNDVKELPVHKHLKLEMTKGKLDWKDVQTLPFAAYSAYSGNRNYNYNDGYNGGKYRSGVTERDQLVKQFPTGSKTEVYIYDFEPYRAQPDRGTGKGYMMESPYSQVELVNIGADEKMGHYEVVVSTFRTEYGSKPKNVLVSRSFSLLEAEENEKEIGDMKSLIEENKQNEMTKALAKAKEEADKKKEAEATSNVIALPGKQSKGSDSGNLRDLIEMSRKLTVKELKSVLKPYGYQYINQVPAYLYLTLYAGCTKLLRDKREAASAKESEESPIAMVAGPGGVMLTAARFDQLTKHGCTNCGANCELEDAPHIFWGEGGSVYCPDCVEEFFDKNAEPLH